MLESIKAESSLCIDKLNFCACWLDFCFSEQTVVEGRQYTSLQGVQLYPSRFQNMPYKSLESSDSLSEHIEVPRYELILRCNGPSNLDNVAINQIMCAPLFLQEESMSEYMHEASD